MWPPECFFTGVGSPSGALADVIHMEMRCIYAEPLGRQVVVEEDGDAAEHQNTIMAKPRPSHEHVTTYNGRSDTPPRVTPHPPHTPVAPSSTSLESADTGVPAYLSGSAQEQQEVFPTSPFATPWRGKQEDEEDSHTESEPASLRRSPWSITFGREIS